MHTDALEFLDRLAIQALISPLEGAETPVFVLAEHLVERLGRTGRAGELVGVRAPGLVTDQPPVSVRWSSQRAEVLNSRYLVAGRAVVFGELRLDDELRIELVGNHEIGGLIESGQAIRPLRLAEANACPGQHVLDGVLDEVADQLAGGVPVAGERTSEKTFVEQDGDQGTQQTRRPWA